jgi:hypothetical protein
MDTFHIMSLSKKKLASEIQSNDVIDVLDSVARSFLNIVSLLS